MNYGWVIGLQIHIISHIYFGVSLSPEWNSYQFLVLNKKPKIMDYNSE